MEASYDPQRVTRAWLVGIADGETTAEEAEALLNELAELAGNLNIGVIGRSIVRLRQSQPKFYLGAGKAMEIVDEVKANLGDCIIFDRVLSPAQQRNWEKLANVTVIDRHEIILDIFNERASTREATLQVELARLEYELPRLRRAWSHLDRQRGGGAVQRDAGETQLEVDQRLVRRRIARLRSELLTVIKTREVQRKQRLRIPLPSVAIVGYTNAGKSSLLNRLTDSSVLAADKLFATLDPTTRRMQLPSGQWLLATDTVGFVRNLPHRLIDAFKATLEEAVVANFLIHVIDAASPDAEAHRATTDEVLKELGIGDYPIITVYNKIDCIDDPIELAALRHSHRDAIFISAHTGEGIDGLLDALQRQISALATHRTLLIPHNRQDLVHQLHEAGAVQSAKYVDDGVLLEANLPPRWVEQMSGFTVHT